MMGIILDIMMPKMSGLDVLCELRKLGIKTPILLLSAKADVSDRIEGLKMIICLSLLLWVN